LVDSIPENFSLIKEDDEQPFYGIQEEWEEVYCHPFLDASNTKFPARAFYIGGSKSWLKYCLYKRKNDSY
jgi:hypothetical protein